MLLSALFRNDKVLGEDGSRGQQNFKYEELSPKFFVPAAGGIALHYLVAMQEDLKERNTDKK